MCDFVSLHMQQFSHTPYASLSLSLSSQMSFQPAAVCDVKRELPTTPVAAAAKEGAKGALNTDDTVTPYAHLVNYLKTYYPGHIKKWNEEHPDFMTKVFPFQELARLLIAERLASHGFGKDDGQSSIAIIRVLLHNRRSTLPSTFVDVAEAQLKAAEAAMASDLKAGVRPMVRTILAWPQAQNLGGFAAFDAKKESEILAEAKRAWPVMRASLEPSTLGETVKVSVPGLAETLWSHQPLADLLANALPGFKLKINHEVSHVTLVNSGVIKETAKCSRDRYEQVMRTLSLIMDGSDFKFKCAMHTLSVDFAPSAICLCIGFESDALDTAIKAIIGEFGLDPEKVKPMLYVTVATSPRFDRFVKPTLPGVGAGAANVAGGVHVNIKGITTTGPVSTFVVGGNVSAAQLEEMMKTRAAHRAARK